MDQEDLVKFKFFFLQKKSNVQQGLISKKGYLTKTEIVLKDKIIPLTLISYTKLRGKRITFGLKPYDKLDNLIRNNIKNNTLTLEFTGKHVDELKRKIDIRLSSILANIHKNVLESQGKGDLFKIYHCPNCSSTIDVSGFSESDTIYCRFCYTIMDKRNNIISDGKKFGLCDECGLFNATKKYDVFLFYFFLIAFGFRYQNRNLCGNCASRIGKKSLLLNLIFVIAVPWSLLMIYNARKNLGQEENELRKANKCIREGEYQQADQYIDNLKTIFPSNHPGIFYNQAIAHINAKDKIKGLGYLDESLNFCSNYSPALSLKNRVQPN